MHVHGIHHLTALTRNAQQNLAFYTQILGLRLVKKTVNQDDVSAYHLFYGDEIGRPGTELTFFDFPSAPQARKGVNEISRISLRVATNEALYYWKERFQQFSVIHHPITTFGHRQVLFFEDPEGQALMLVSDEHEQVMGEGKPWGESPVPIQYGIIGLGPVFLTISQLTPIILLLEQLGFTEKERLPAFEKGQAPLIVMHVTPGGTGKEIILEHRTDLPLAQQGNGGVHHVAFRVQNEKELNKWMNQMNHLRIPHSNRIDRFYFQSLYFREPNGILFELATDGPGFTIDEPVESLGQSLSLPPFLEDRRSEIETQLIQLK